MPTIEGKLLKEWREHCGLDQRQLAEAIKPESTASGVSNFENGPSSMSVATIVRFLDALAVPGEDDRARLSNFFLGPEDAALKAAKDEERRAQARLERRLTGRGRGR